MPILQGAFDDVKKHYKRHGILGFVPPELRESGRRLLPQAHLASEYSDYGDLVEMKEGVEQAVNSPLLSWDTLEGANRAIAGGAALVAGPLLSSRLLRDGVDLAASEAGRIARGYVGTPSERGIFAGVNAKTADLEALEKAKGLAADGADARRIWDETGWFKGADDKWRFEIDDSGAVYTPDTDHIKVGDVYSHEPLMQAYPDVASLGYSRGYDKTWQGKRAFEGLYDDGHVTIHDQLGRKGGGPVMGHEVQHFIQDREGFAGGGNPSNFIADELIPLIEEADAMEDSLLGQSWRAGTPEERKELKALSQEWGAKKRALQRRAADFRHDQYRRLAGETEARNVDARTEMTPDERRAKPPWETEDVPRDQQIVRFE